MKIRLFLLSLMALVPQLAGGAFPAIQAKTIARPWWPSEWVADPSFLDLWARSDLPVAWGKAARSWLWGPLPFAVANEPYAESPTGLRLVEYLDKGRMEVNDPSADRSSPWFATTGLLVSEMVSGRVQTGNAAFEPRQPAAVPVAGDPTDPNAPTYASFASLASPAPDQTGKALSGKLARDGRVTPFAGVGDARLYQAARYDHVTHHNVPAVFATWGDQAGLVLSHGRFVSERLFDPLYLLGRPITEAYWADVLIDGSPSTVLVQLYERRALTYNPRNPPEWRVEMANVGRAYFRWRYGEGPPPPSIAAEIGEREVSVRGWNWPGGAPGIKVEVLLAGAANPLAGPMEANADGAGRFRAALPYSEALRSALLSGAYTSVRAVWGQSTVALPLASGVPAGTVALAGTLSAIEQLGGNRRAMTLLSVDGREWAVALPPGVQLSYSEGPIAPLTALEPGSSILVQSRAGQEQGEREATLVRLLSASAGGAKVGYRWPADGSALEVSGAGWPAERSVRFALSRVLTGTTAPNDSFGTLRSDSRGNIAGRVRPPTWEPSQWLYAWVGEEGAVPIAQVAMPAGAVGVPGDAPPPQLYIIGTMSSAQGYLGAYCMVGRCVEAIGTPLSGHAVGVRARDLLAFRPQQGPDPHVGPSPLRFSAQLYSYPADEGPVLRGIHYFAPEGQPVHGTLDLPGRPFSISLPEGIAAGKYALLVRVVWPGQGGEEIANYGFALDVR